MSLYAELNMIKAYRFSWFLVWVVTCQFQKINDFAYFLLHTALWHLKLVPAFRCCDLLLQPWPTRHSVGGQLFDIDLEFPGLSAQSICCLTLVFVFALPGGMGARCHLARSGMDVQSELWLVPALTPYYLLQTAFTSAKVWTTNESAGESWCSEIWVHLANFTMAHASS